jgi:predicted Rossmann fold flavoprotein
MKAAWSRPSSVPEIAPCDFDIAVLGAGAAGLVAAIRAAELGRRVALLEKNRRPGVKILISGGTRCNITNARGLRDLRVVSGPIDPAFEPRECRGPNAIVRAFGPNGEFLKCALRAFSVEESVRLFEDEGVPTKVEANGKIFPVSDRALHVLAALERRLERSGACLRVNSGALGVEPSPTGSFAVRLADSWVSTRRVIVTVGGQSYPGCGTTGDGYAFARRFGHTIVPPLPALVPLRSTAPWVTALKGVALPDVIVAVLDEAGHKRAERREALLFTHFGLSGPAVLDVSRAVTRAENPDRLGLRIDLCPGIHSERLDAQLIELCRAGRLAVAGIVARWLPRRLADTILSLAGIPADRVGPELSRAERQTLVALIRTLPVPVSGSLGFEKAEVTSGGVALDELNPETLESRRQPGLHFAGEVLDLDGLIGGYNFQAAWSTGWLAGQSAARIG